MGSRPPLATKGMMPTMHLLWSVVVAATLLCGWDGVEAASVTLPCPPRGGVAPGAVHVVDVGSWLPSAAHPPAGSPQRVQFVRCVLDTTDVILDVRNVTDADGPLEIVVDGITAVPSKTGQLSTARFVVVNDSWSSNATVPRGSSQIRDVRLVVRGAEMISSAYQLFLVVADRLERVAIHIADCRIVLENPAASMYVASLLVGTSVRESGVVIERSAISANGIGATVGTILATRGPAPASCQDLFFSVTDSQLTCSGSGEIAVEAVTAAVVSLAAVAGGMVVSRVAMHVANAIIEAKSGKYWAMVSSVYCVTNQPVTLTNVTICVSDAQLTSKVANDASVVIGLGTGTVMTLSSISVTVVKSRLRTEAAGGGAIAVTMGSNLDTTLSDVRFLFIDVIASGFVGHQHCAIATWGPWLSGVASTANVKLLACRSSFTCSGSSTLGMVLPRNSVGLPSDRDGYHVALLNTSVRSPSACATLPPRRGPGAGNNEPAVPLSSFHRVSFNCQVGWSRPTAADHFTAALVTVNDSPVLRQSVADITFFGVQYVVEPVEPPVDCLAAFDLTEACPAWPLNWDSLVPQIKHPRTASVTAVFSRSANQSRTATGGPSVTTFLDTGSASLSPSRRRSDSITAPGLDSVRRRSLTLQPPSLMPPANGATSLVTNSGSNAPVGTAAAGQGAVVTRTRTIALAPVGWSAFVSLPVVPRVVQATAVGALGVAAAATVHPLALSHARNTIRSLSTGECRTPGIDDVDIEPVDVIVVWSVDGGSSWGRVVGGWLNAAVLLPVFPLLAVFAYGRGGVTLSAVPLTVAGYFLPTAAYFGAILATDASPSRRPLVGALCLLVALAFVGTVSASVLFAARRGLTGIIGTSAVPSQLHNVTPPTTDRGMVARLQALLAAAFDGLKTPRGILVTAAFSEGLSVATGISMMSGLSFRDRSACLWRCVGIAVLSAAHLVYVSYVRPNANRLDNALFVIEASLQMAASVLQIVVAAGRPFLPASVQEMVSFLVWSQTVFFFCSAAVLLVSEFVTRRKAATAEAADLDPPLLKEVPVGTDRECIVHDAEVIHNPLSS